jgi:hypothetical protein
MSLMVTRKEAAQVLGALGGKARSKNLTATELSAIGKKGGRARAKSLTAAQRSAIARKAVLARIAKYQEKRRTKK